MTESIINIPSVEIERIPTGVKEFDEFLGGGFVHTQTILMAGEPGVGKSTLLTQLSTLLVDTGNKVLYVSGEESLSQIKLRADRLGTLRQHIYCSETIVIEELYKTIEQVDAKFIIVDSLQMLKSNTLKQEQGSAKQMKYCLLEMIDYAKKHDKVLIFIGHATKSGMIAGLLTLQHMVDAVLYIKHGENGNRYVETHKNRFANAQRTFNLTMTEQGFKEFSRHIVKGSQVAPDYARIKAQITHGDNYEISGNQINSVFTNRFNKFLFNVALGTLQRILFNNKVTDKYTINFNLKG